MWCNMLLKSKYKVIMNCVFYLSCSSFWDGCCRQHILLRQSLWMGFLILSPPLCVLTHWPWEIWMKFNVDNFQANFSEWWLRYLYETAISWMPLDFTHDNSTLVQVMAWCHQATSHYLSQCRPRSMLPNGATRHHRAGSVYMLDNTLYDFL